MILYFYGVDTLRSRRYLEQSVAQFRRARDQRGYNVVRLDGKTTEAGRLLSEFTAAPFLALKRLVVVENILSAKDTAFLEQTQTYLSGGHLPDTTVVIFWQGEAPGKTSEAKALQALLAKEQYAREFASLTGAKLTDWIRAEAAERGAVVSPAAAAYIAENSGGDMWLIGTLIDVLRAYTAGAAIEPKDAAVFLPKKLDDNIFSLTDALAAGNCKTALTLLYEQRRLGEDDQKIFPLIVWQFRVLLILADALEREPGLPSDALAAKTGLKPFVVRKNLAIVRKFSLAELQAAYRQLLTIDRQTKTGQADQSVLLDVFAVSRGGGGR